MGKKALNWNADCELQLLATLWLQPSFWLGASLLAFLQRSRLCMRLTSQVSEGVWYRFVTARKRHAHYR